MAIQVAMITGGQLFASLIDGAFSGDKQNGWRFMLGIAGEENKLSEVPIKSSLHRQYCSDEMFLIIFPGLLS